MKSDIKKLINRGYFDHLDMTLYQSLEISVLIEMVNHQEPYLRTVSIRVLKDHASEEVLITLINRLLIEKKLYTKIELSQVISTYGQFASKNLIQYLGSVGKNQHKSLPEKPFGKNNYPLPRDIVTRTLCLIGIEALDDLMTCLKGGSYNQKLEAVDGIGFITYYQKDSRAKDLITGMFHEYKEDELMIWKLLRALQAFSGGEVITILTHYQNSKIKAHQWEAERSLKQIQRNSHKEA